MILVVGWVVELYSCEYVLYGYGGYEDAHQLGDDRGTGLAKD
jgi:hypothetical protein